MENTVGTAPRHAGAHRKPPAHRTQRETRPPRGPGLFSRLRKRGAGVPQSFRPVRTAVWLIVLVLLFYFLVMLLGIFLEIAYQYALNVEKLIRIQAEIDSGNQIIESVADSYDQMCGDSLRTIRYLLSDGGATAARVQAAPASPDGEQGEAEPQPEPELPAPWTLDAVDRFLSLSHNGQELLIADRQGRILRSSTDSPPDLTKPEFLPLFDVFEEEPSPAQVEYTLRSSVDQYGNDIETTRRYYALPLDSARMVVLGVDPSELASLRYDLTSWPHILGIADCGEESTSFVISAQDKTVLYHPESRYIGEHFDDRAVLPTGINFGGELTLEKEDTASGVAISGVHLGIGALDSSVCVYVMSGEKDGRHVVSALDVGQMARSIQRLVFLQSALFAVLAGLMALYALLTCRRPSGQPDNENRWKKRLFGMWQDRLLYRKLQGFMVLCVAALFFAALLSRTLFSLSHYSMNLAGQEQTVTSYLSDSQDDQKILTRLYTDSYFTRCQVVNRLLTEQPGHAGKAYLDELCDTMGIRWLTVFDLDGTAAATNAGADFRLSVGADSDITQNVLGRLPAGTDYVEYTVAGTSDMLIGCRIRDAAGLPAGVLLAAFDNHQQQWVRDNLSLDSLLRQMHPGMEGFAFAVDRETGLFTSYPDESLIGRPAADHGLTQAQLVGSYQNFLTLDSVSYMAFSIDNAATGGSIVYLVVPESDISAMRLPFALLAALLGLLLLRRLYRSLTMRRGKKGQPPETPAPATLPLLDKGAIPSILQKPVGKWLRLAPGAQIFVVLRLLFSIAAILLSVLVLSSSSIFGNDSSITYILQRRWSPGPNVFAFTYCGILIAVSITAVLLLDFLTDYAFRALAIHSETIRKLLHSVLRYVAVLLTVYLALGFLGVDANAMVASIGVFSLVIALGAQPLISDIISGLFFIIEGSFKVGDIIQINGWRGTVQEIGLRTTKVVGPSDNIMTLSNRSISNVVNMSNLSSVVVVSLTIDYKEDLEAIEKMLKEYLPSIAQRVPNLTGGPYYSGVTEIGGSRITVTIVANCPEAKRNYVMRDLNRELIRMFEIDSVGLHGRLRDISLKAVDSAPE